MLYNSFILLNIFTLLNCIQGDHATVHMKELPIHTHTIQYIQYIHIQFMDGLPAPRYIMSIIVSSYQHCDEQQFQTLSCALYTIFSVIKL